MEEEIHPLKRIFHTEDVDIWHCFVCSREFVIQYKPFKKTVIIEGNTTVRHSGGDGLNLSSANVEETDEKLQPFDEWLKKFQGG